MSTAESFVSFENFSREDLLYSDPRRWGPNFAPNQNFDSVDITLQEAYHLYFNLEDLEFVTACTRGPADITWTTTLGATESMPFTVDASTKLRLGSYYTASGNPACAPKVRIYNSLLGQYSIIHRSFDSGGTGRIQIEFQFAGTPSANTIQLHYRFAFWDYVSSTERVLIANPAMKNQPIVGNTPITGTPPSTGTIYVLGIPMNWNGGGVNGNAWSTETATLSTTSAAFTY